MERLLLSGKDWKLKEFLGEDWVWRNAHHYVECHLYNESNIQEGEVLSHE